MTTVDSIDTDVASVIRESGNRLHCQVANALQRAKWQTLMSPYYLDAGTNKAREIDLIAEKKWDVRNSMSEVRGHLLIRLFVECKYLRDTTVFWFGAKDIDATKAMLTKRTPLVSGRSTLRDHHYLKDETLAAKLFASGKNKSNPENDVMYKALNQCLNALVRLRGRGALTRAPQHQQRELPIIETVEMPIVLVNSFSKCHQVEIQNEDTATPIAKNFQLEVNYAFAKVDKPVSEFFLIDVVELDQLDAFLNTVDKDVEAMLLTIPEE